MIPAMTRIGTIPSTKRAARPPARARDSRRGSKPGKSMPRAISRPAPPAMKMAGSSSTPWGATKVQSWSAIPARHVAAPITPMSMPLVTIIQIVPMPAVIPIAKVVKDTARLLVRMPEAASGLIVTMDCVHISFLSMVSIICGPSMRCAKVGS